MQINGQTPEQQGTEQRVGAPLGLPNAPGITLKLPSSLSQSPNVFSGVFAAAEFEEGFRKNLEFTRNLELTRKVQQVRFVQCKSNF